MDATDTGRGARRVGSKSFGGGDEVHNLTPRGHGSHFQTNSMCVADFL